MFENKYELIEYRTNLRTKLSESQNHRCCYCGVKMWHKALGETGNKFNLATLEHLTCQKFSGEDSEENCVVACAWCNSKRGHESYDKFFVIVVKSISSFGNINKMRKKFSYFSENLGNVYRRAA